MGRYIICVIGLQKYLAPFQKQHHKAIKSAMAMLAFSKTQVQQSIAGKERAEKMTSGGDTKEKLKHDSSLKRKRSSMQSRLAFSL